MKNSRLMFVLILILLGLILVGCEDGVLLRENEVKVK